MNMSETIAFPLLNEPYDIIAPTWTHPFWQGSSVINIKLYLTDDTEKVIQFSTDYAKVFARAILKRCGE